MKILIQDLMNRQHAWSNVSLILLIDLFKNIQHMILVQIVGLTLSIHVQVRKKQRR